MFGPCFGEHYLVSFEILQSSGWGGEDWLFCFISYSMPCDSLRFVHLPHSAVIRVGLQCMLVAFSYHTAVVPTKSDSYVIFCLQLFI